MSLYVERTGSGAPLLLLHGWGMHSGMWGSCVTKLATQFQVLAVDLPGHGYSPPQAEFSLDSIVDQLAAQFSEPINLCGWSLGGLIALRFAERFPQQLSRLALVSSTPCFVKRPDWDCAMAAETLAGFGAALQDNYALTLRRFLALQTGERALLSELRNALTRRNTPDQSNLQAGLAMLRDTDLRSALPSIRQPALIIAGSRDTLAPLAAAHYLARQLPEARLAMIEHAAHVPFLSHPDQFLEHLTSFLHE
jgi:pimeloyl-[acyl-carrier protein] methyl ester esterase